MNLNNKRKKYVKIDQNTDRESDLEDGIDKLMNDSDTEFVFEKSDSEKDDFSNDQLKNILITEVKIHVIENRGENPDDREEESQEGRVDVPKAKNDWSFLELLEKGFPTPKETMKSFC